ncbi:MAG: hypothetical protein M3R04_05340 [bacterium]|nr:hypothetical protein [bacterium]
MTRYPNRLMRRRWFRALAWLGGALVLLAHVYTLDTPPGLRNLFEANLRDVVYHSSMLTLFTLAFRASLTTVEAASRPRRSARVATGKAGTKPRPTLSPADATALWVCCGWGAFCECLQLLIPAREFSLIELALNIGVPVLVIALYSLAGRRGD